MEMPLDKSSSTSGSLPTLAESDEAITRPREENARLRAAELAGLRADHARSHDATWGNRDDARNRLLRGSVAHQFALKVYRSPSNVGNGVRRVENEVLAATELLSNCDDLLPRWARSASRRLPMRNLKTSHRDRGKWSPGLWPRLKRVVPRRTDPSHIEEGPNDNVMGKACTLRS